jgi:phospholipid/cholesterol/gamma-HCH transport system substrate-binding protein
VRRSSPALVGALALLVLAAITVLGFTRGLPLGDPYEIHAEFASANSIREGSPVRIAGVDVGRVVQVERRGDGARVTLAIEDEGRPVRADATAKIRPRIFLEGNFFVDLKPGTDGARELADGATLPVTRTATPVQLDQVLTALQSDTRQDLRDVLDVLGRALTEERDGESAAESLNDAYADGAPALRATARVAEALLGEEPERDLRRLLTGTGRATGALVRNEALLQALVRDLRVTFDALAGEQAALRAALRELPDTLATAEPALASLDRAFPATRAFARELLPGVRETARTIDAAFPWIRQARPLVSRAELGGLARDLAPATGDLARVVQDGLRLLPALDDVARCAQEVVLPAGEIVIRDEFATGEENYKDFFYALVGLAGEGQNGDGNGAYVRFQPGGGATTIALGRGNDRVYGNAGAPPQGVRPRLPRRRPPVRDDVPCHTQAVPDVNGPAGARGPADEVVSGAAR